MNVFILSIEPFKIDIRLGLLMTGIMFYCLSSVDVQKHQFIIPYLRFVFLSLVTKIIILQNPIHSNKTTNEAEQDNAI